MSRENEHLSGAKAVVSSLQFIHLISGYVFRSLIEDKRLGLDEGTTLLEYARWNDPLGRAVVSQTLSTCNYLDNLSLALESRDEHQTVSPQDEMLLSPDPKVINLLWSYVELGDEIERDEALLGLRQTAVMRGIRQYPPTKTPQEPTKIS